MPRQRRSSLGTLTPVPRPRVQGGAVMEDRLCPPVPLGLVKPWVLVFEWENMLPAVSVGVSAGNRWQAETGELKGSLCTECWQGSGGHRAVQFAYLAQACLGGTDAV